MSHESVPENTAGGDRVGPFSPQAIEFIRNGLAHTVKMIHGDAEASDDERRHVNGQQLCHGLKDYAIRQYGLLAKTVLNSWGVHNTEDFGKIVFAMVEAEQMRKTDEDTIEDFRAVFDFDDAFGDLTPSR